MSNWQRIRKILVSLFMIIWAVLIWILNIYYGTGYEVILFGMISYLLIHSIRLLVFYFTMARFMNGGNSMFYRGILLLNLAVFTFSLNSFPKALLVAYLVGSIMVTSILQIFHAFESKKINGHWKIPLFNGILTIGVTLFILVFIKIDEAIILIYTLALLIDAIDRFIMAFRPNKLITIQ